MCGLFIYFPAELSDSHFTLRLNFDDSAVMLSRWALGTNSYVETLPHVCCIRMWDLWEVIRIR